MRCLLDCAMPPQIFSELMSVLQQGLNSFALAYLDDILILTTTVENHRKHIQTVFQRLREHGLKLKAKKCSFLKEKTRHLRPGGIRPDSDKVVVIRSPPNPTSVKEVRSFTGMWSYYRRCPTSLKEQYLYCYFRRSTPNLNGPNNVNVRLIF